ncbi:MAG: cell division protein ZapE [Rhodothalassiaceae bacterium]|nr:MAG: cell division protein ZapE [Rhodothalassiaceae bacterium]
MNRAPAQQGGTGAEGEGVLARWRALVAAGELARDPDQERVAAALDALRERLMRPAPRRGLLSRIGLGLRGGAGKDHGPPPAPAPRHIYIWGEVGRGKSLLMDLFFESLAGGPVAGRRVHFHEFMAEVHARLAWWRKAPAAAWKEVGLDPDGGRNPVRAHARELGRGIRLLCFDEFQVTNIADASVLGQLFAALAAGGVSLVATSNRAPGELYKDGLNRDRFLPTIRWIEENFAVLAMCGPTDYRLKRFAGLSTYLVPVNAETTEQLRRAFYQLTDREVEDPAKVPSDEIIVGGRRIFVPKAIRGVAVFSFKRLCANPHGAADYLAIAHRYHTVFVVAIPQMDDRHADMAHRFMTMIDVFYDQGVKLVCSAAVPPDRLYTGRRGAFEFQRTVSRLIEMQTRGYLERGHGARANGA